MSIPGSVNPLFLGASGQATGYRIERSLRFNSADSAYLSRTPASSSNRKTWSWAGWVKRSDFGAINHVFNTGAGVSLPVDGFTFEANNTLKYRSYDGSSEVINLVTTQVFRDPSAWFHLVFAIDTTQSTSTNRVKIYVNGAQITAFSTATYGSPNYDTGVNATMEHRLGDYAGSNQFSGYLADIHFIDGQALTPSSFTEVSATTGQLVPKAYSGPTPTGNSFWLPFSDNSAATATTLGKDNFNLGNNWSPNNVSVITGGPTSVAAASGALPIYNTTDTYGTTKGTGTRTDSNSSSIVLAIPMDGANNGTTFTDESATIKGSGSTKSITRNGDTKTLAAQSKFYGSSGYFDGNGDYLQLANSTDFDFGTGNFTIEAWVYTTATSGQLLMGYDPINEFNFDANALYFGRSGTFSSTLGATVSTNTWQHIALVRNGSTITSYVNGIAGSTPYNISTNTVAFTTGTGTLIGRNHISAGTAGFFSGYIQDFRVYKGVAKYTGNFNPPSSTANSTIAAGNDSLVDSPTSYGTGNSGGDVRGNYCTLNPLSKQSSCTLSNGNLDYASGTSTANSSAWGTFNIPTSGKWYWEYTLTAVAEYSFCGISQPLDNSKYALYYGINGSLQADTGITSGGAALANGDVVGVAVNVDAGTIAFYKNGVSQLSISYATSSGLYAPVVRSGTNGQTPALSINFGQRAFSYTAPTNFQPLVDTLLPAPPVAKPNTVMDVVLWTGNVTARTISGLNFSPDLVWIKNRSTAQGHTLYDTVRGATLALVPNGTDAELTLTNFLTAFTSDGFSIGTDNNPNGSGNGIVGWAWDAGTSTDPSNTAGSISSQVRANVSAGFSIVTMTLSGGNTVGHGLGIAPSLIILKKRNGTSGWPVYHSSLGGTNALELNSTNAVATNSGYWNNANPTSTVFTTGSFHVGDYVAYCFAPVAGYSAMGSYVGNGSSDGPFVYTGFRTRWIMVKRSDSTGNWTIKDTSRPGYNVTNLNLFANLSNAETTEYPVDLLSNGFKVREGTFSDWNANGGTYVWAAFAESSFQYSRAR